jgi:hypothetical protein
VAPERQPQQTEPEAEVVSCGEEPFLQRMSYWRNADLDAGRIDAIIDAARAYPHDGIKASDLERKLGYFRNNAHRMRYAHFRNLGMFTGSGAIEGGIKAIVVQRAKQSGMHWSVEGAADVIFLRCQHASGRWNELWPARSARPVPLHAAI